MRVDEAVIASCWVFYDDLGGSIERLGGEKRCINAFSFVRKFHVNNSKAVCNSCEDCAAINDGVEGRLGRYDGDKMMEIRWGCSHQPSAIRDKLNDSSIHHQTPLIITTLNADLYFHLVKQETPNLDLIQIFFLLPNLA